MTIIGNRVFKVTVLLFPQILVFILISVHCNLYAGDSDSLVLNLSMEVSRSDENIQMPKNNEACRKLEPGVRKVFRKHLPVIEDYFETRTKRDGKPLLSLSIFATALVTINKLYDISGAPKMTAQAEDRELHAQQGADKFQHFKLGEISYIVSEKITGSPTTALVLGAISSYIPEIVENPAHTGGKNNQDVLATSLGVLTKYISEQFLKGAFVTGLKINDNPGSFTAKPEIFNLSGGKPGRTEYFPSTFTIGLNLNRLTGKKDILGAYNVVIYYELNAFGGGHYPIFPY